jgi:hypothetical protein
MKDLTEGKLSQELEYANTIGSDTLQRCIDHLKQVDENMETETTVSNDFAPRSFYFQRVNKNNRFCGNGGVIFHDITQRIGTCGAPSFSVSIENDPQPHWQIHT